MCTYFLLNNLKLIFSTLDLWFPSRCLDKLKVMSIKESQKQMFLQEAPQKVNPAMFGNI